MKKFTLLFGIMIASNMIQSQNGLEGIIVEKYYVSNAADAAGTIGILPVGSVTYRVFADMLPGYKFQAMYGNASHDFKVNTTTTFFNNEDRGATTSNAIPSIQMKNNSVALDSWFSVGAAAAGQLGVLKTEDNGVANILPIASNPMLKNADPSAGITLNVQDGIISGTPEAVTTVGFTTELDIFDATSQQGNSFLTNNGAISALSGATGPTANNRVLLGQFTTDGLFGFELNVQIGTPTPGVTETYVAKNATGNEIVIPSLIYSSSVATDLKSSTKITADISIIPNPAKDMFTITIVKNRLETTTDNFYSIYDSQGSLVLQNKLGEVSDSFSKNVDISTLSSGMYFVALSLDGIITTKKIVKID